jgi:hypothetical protein
LSFGQILQRVQDGDAATTFTFHLDPSKIFEFLEYPALTTRRKFSYDSATETATFGTMGKSKFHGTLTSELPDVIRQALKTFTRSANLCPAWVSRRLLACAKTGSGYVNLGRSV